MNSTRLVTLTALWASLVVASGCQVEGDQARGKDMEAMTKIARQYILENRPEWKAEIGGNATISESNGRYEVTWVLPKDMLGGAPVVIIDKKTRRVLEAYHTQ